MHVRQACVWGRRAEPACCDVVYQPRPRVQGRRTSARRLKKQASWLGIQRRSALREAAFQQLPPAARGPADAGDGVE